MKEYSIHYCFMNHKVGLLLIYFNIHFSKKKYSTETAISRKQNKNLESGRKQFVLVVGYFFVELD